MKHRLINSNVDLVLLRDPNGQIYLITFGTSLDTHTVRQKAFATAELHPHARTQCRDIFTSTYSLCAFMI